MPGSYIEVGGVRYDVPATGDPIRFLNDAGVEQFSITQSGANMVLNFGTGNQLKIFDTTFGANSVNALTTINVGSLGGPDGTVNINGNFFFDAGLAGTAFMTGLPTADPQEAGQLYTTNGALMVSAGA